MCELLISNTQYQRRIYNVIKHGHIKTNGLTMVKTADHTGDR